jgi:hypothetical protein
MWYPSENPFIDTTLINEVLDMLCKGTARKQPYPKRTIIGPYHGFKLTDWNTITRYVNVDGQDIGVVEFEDDDDSYILPQWYNGVVPTPEIMAKLRAVNIDP